jgi:hypothetical protein
MWEVSEELLARGLAVLKEPLSRFVVDGEVGRGDAGRVDEDRAAVDTFFV